MSAPDDSQSHRLIPGEDAHSRLHVSHPGISNYEKHTPRVSQVIAAVAKVSCKHGLWLVARVNKNPSNHAR